MQVISAENLVPAYIPEDIKSVRLHFEFEDEKEK